MILVERVSSIFDKQRSVLSPLIFRWGCSNGCNAKKCGRPSSKLSTAGQADDPSPRHPKWQADIYPTADIHRLKFRLPPYTCRSPGRGGGRVLGLSGLSG